MTIAIFTTGGTIDKVYFDAKSEFEVGRPIVSTILEEAGVAVPFETHALMRKDSLQIDAADRARIRAAVADCNATQVLITHGTDTMTDTAAALEDVVGKTIVLTGALAPAAFRSTDAVFNIGLAVAAVQLCRPGVYIAMNGEVFASGTVRKNRERNCFERI